MKLNLLLSLNKRMNFGNTLCKSQKRGDDYENNARVGMDYVCFMDRLHYPSYFTISSSTICIDHHKAIETIADFNHIDSSSAATAELIYLLLRELGHVFDEEEAMAVYTGITTDTGNFLYSNTTARSHAIAREIMETGMDSNRVNVYVYESESLEKIKLQGQAVAGALSFADGKGILATVTQEDLKETGAHMADTEGTQ